MQTKRLLNADLLQTFDVPTPRYTSYPTALSFEEGVAMPPLHASDRDAPVSLYFHMMFCRSMCWYCACTKEITRRTSRGGEYVTRLFDELEHRADWLRGRPIAQIHLGGGTPTFFRADDLAALARFIRMRFDVLDDAELSVEIDPRELSDEQVASLAAGGFRRASLGVQDHEPAVQAAINRIQPYEMTADAAERLRGAGIESLNFDLVYGLPFQTPESFRRTVEDVVALSPDRLAVYSYAHVPWVAPAQKLVTRKTTLPGPDEKIAMFLAAIDVLTDAGYRHIGMDHFAKPDDALAVALDEGTLRRNFMGYTTLRGVDIQAFGASGISQTRDGYFQNTRELAEWESLVDAEESTIKKGYLLDADDRLRREVIMGIMCSNEVDFATVGEPFGVDARDHFDAEIERLEPLEREGLVELDGDRLTVTDIGRFLVRNIATTFDVRRRATGYSKAI